MTALTTAAQVTVRPESVVRVMRLIAQAEDRTIVRLLAGGEEASLFLDRGRVAWAAVPSTRRYLSERLEAIGVPRATVDAFRLARRPLSGLIDAGQLTRGQFERVLFEHTLASLRHALSRTLGEIEFLRWTGEAPPFSFPAIQLLCATAAGPQPSPPSAPAPDFLALRCEQREGHCIPTQHWGRVPETSFALELMTHGAQVMQRMGTGRASFRRGNRCWSVDGAVSAFVVSAGTSPLSFSWMLSPLE